MHNREKEKKFNMVNNEVFKKILRAALEFKDCNEAFRDNNKQAVYNLMELMGGINALAMKFTAETSGAEMTTQEINDEYFDCIKTLATSYLKTIKTVRVDKFQSDYDTQETH